MPEDEGDLGTVGGLAGAKDHRHRLAGRCLVDVDREEAVAVVVGIEQGQLLAAVHPIKGVIDVEQDAPRDLREAVAEQLDHRIHHADERCLRRQVLQPRHGRLRAEFGARLGQVAHRHLESGIIPQGVAVVGIRVTGGDQQSPVADHLGKAMPHPPWRPWIGDAASQPLGDTEPPLDLGQHQHAGIRGQPPAVEGDMHRLAGDG